MFHLTFPTTRSSFSMVKEIGHAQPPFRRPFSLIRKSKPPPDDPEESKRFIDMAREIGAQEPSPDFELAFRKVAEKPKGRHRSMPSDRRSRRSGKPDSS